MSVEAEGMRSLRFVSTRQVQATPTARLHSGGRPSEIQDLEGRKIFGTVAICHPLKVEGMNSAYYNR